MSQDEGAFETRYQLLFSIVTFTGIFIPLLAGAFVDRAGWKICLLVTSLICFFGQILAAIGVQDESWPGLLSGRFIYGLGVEGVLISNDALLACIFEGGKLGLAFGFVMASAYIGYLLSTIISPRAANRVNVAFAFWLGVIMQGMALVAAVVLFMIGTGTPVSDEELSSHVRAGGSNENELARSETSGGGGEQDGVRLEAADEEYLQSEVEAEGYHGCTKVCRCRWLNFGTLFWLLCFSCVLVYSVTMSFTGTAQGVLLERNLFIDPPQDCLLEYPDKCPSGYLAPTGGNPSTDATGEACPVDDNYAPVLPTSLKVTEGDPSWDKTEYVFLSLESSDVDCTDDFWSQACTPTYCDEREEATEKAGVLMSIPFMITMTTAFLFGHFGVDRAGLRAEMLCFAPILLVVAFALFAFLRSSPIAPLVLIGIGQTIEASALWPSVPLVVPKNVKGMAFGVVTCIQGIGLTLWPLFNAAIHNNTGYHYLPGVATFLMLCSVAAFVVGFTLLCFDRRHDGKLRIRDSQSNEEV
jgi:MFS family permease